MTSYGKAGMTANFNSAIREWQKILGADGVSTDTKILTSLATATYPTSSTVPAVIYPSSVSQVQECLKVANQFQTPLYPISTGKNWGLGSSAPVGDSQVIMSLERMNKILAFDERLGYVRVQPGVTFSQLFDFLQKQGSNLMLDVTGAHGSTSIVGNSVEKGHGMGLLADRFSQVTDLEVVLGTGEVVKTGYSRFGGDSIGALSKWGIGPEMQGLFAQSSFGVVAALTLWLQPQPKVIVPFFFGGDTISVMADAVIHLSRLKAGGSKISFRMFNDYRMMSFTSRFPEGANTPLNAADKSQLRANLGWSHDWYGLGAIYAESMAEALAIKDIVSSTISQVDTLAFFQANHIEIHHSSLPNISFASDFQASIRASFAGVPISGVGMCYWRMSSQVQTSTTPEKDQCGVIWVCPKVPLHRDAIIEFNEITGRCFAEFELEPNIGLLFPTSRSIDATVALLYDRTKAGADARAEQCHRTLFERLNQAEFLPYRLSTQSMNWLTYPDGNRWAKALKAVFDPNNILAPGRYI